MVLMQERIEQGALIRDSISAGTFADTQGQQPLQRFTDRRLGCGQARVRQLLVPHPIDGRRPPQWQFNPTSLLQLQQQGAGGHIFELADPIAPLPTTRQFSAQSPAAPIRMLRQQLPNLFHLVRPNSAALNDTLCFAHAPQPDRGGSRSPEKNGTIFSFPGIGAYRHTLSPPVHHRKIADAHVLDNAQDRMGCFMGARRAHQLLAVVQSSA